MLFLLPTCENVWALSIDHIFLGSQNSSVSVKSTNRSSISVVYQDDSNSVHPLDIFCGTQHTHHSPYKDCCDSDPERLDMSVPLRGNELGQSSSKEVFTGNVFAFHETVRNTHRVSGNQMPIPSVFDRQTYTNLVGIIKRLD